MTKYIAVDFDGTVVDHRYPCIGAEVPEAVRWLRTFVEAGAKLILFTMRGQQPLQDAVQWYAERNIPLFGVNHNPTQDTWTNSPKAYAQIYIDDAAIGCPLRANPRSGGRPFVDWSIVGPLVMEQLA